jgi:predicted phage-related endonuclease
VSRRQDNLINPAPALPILKGDYIMSVIELSSTAREFRQLQAQIKALEEEADTLKAVMVKEMDTRQVDSLDAEEFVIKYNIIESSRFDSTKLKTEEPDIYTRYLKRTTSLRFMVA